MNDEPLRAEPGRLDAVLARLTGIPRAEVQRAITAGRVRVDGQTRPRSYKLVGGELLEVELLDVRPPEPEPNGVPVRYEDEHLLVIAKPAGLVTHPTRARDTGTLVNKLLGMGVELAPSEDALRPGIVHRLDVGTSGLMVVAKTEVAAAGLKATFARHEADRRYLALVRGEVGDDSFEVEAPLGRRAARVAIDRVEGRPAATLFTVAERLGRATLLEAAPRTGRTHQIRVHLKAVGHPILGDRAYGGGGDLARQYGLSRPFLHSWKLGFDHPIGGRRVQVEEPLPPDLVEALDRARSDLRS